MNEGILIFFYFNTTQHINECIRIERKLEELGKSTKEKKTFLTHSSIVFIVKLRQLQGDTYIPIYVSSGHFVTSRAKQVIKIANKLQRKI